MIAIASLGAVLVLSVTVTRIATIMLAHTGLSRQAARFQARSAFTGVGFTTSESELVVSHPARRRILLTLMLLGNAGVVTAVGSLVVAFAGTESDDRLMRLGLIIAGASLIWWFAQSDWVDRRLSRFIEWGLARWTDLEVRDYPQLLHLGGAYRVVELNIEEGDWLAERSLTQAALDQEGLQVLGIERASGDYEGLPSPSAELHPGDKVVIYGSSEQVAELGARPSGLAGSLQHQDAVAAEMARQEEDPATASSQDEHAEQRS